MRIKDESEWVKIPDHHQPLVSKETFEQVQAQLPHIKSTKKNHNLYPLRSKVFCGCCRHAMPRSSNKNHVFICRYTKADPNSPCSGLRIAEAELEELLFEILYKQAQIILGLDNLSNVGQLDIQLAEQAEYDNRIEEYMDEKRMLYEQLIMKQITKEDYKAQKAAIDIELDRLRVIHSKLKMQTSQMQMAEKEKNARTELVQEISGAGGLTTGLVETLIERVYVYPDSQVEIVWKMKDFCMEGM